MNKTRKRINAIDKQREALLKERYDIQKNCKHENGTYSTLFSWRIGQSEPAEFCNDCKEPIKFPQREEIAKAWGMSTYNSNEEKEENKGE